MDPIDRITLDLEVARHKRELTEAFAKLRKEWGPPPRKDHPARPMRPEDYAAFYASALAADQAPAAGWHNALAMQQSDAYVTGIIGAGLLGGIFGNAYALQWPGNANALCGCAYR